MEHSEFAGLYVRLGIYSIILGSSSVGSFESPPCSVLERQGGS
jgi:hypothetical protein